MMDIKKSETCTYLKAKKAQLQVLAHDTRKMAETLETAAKELGDLLDIIERTPERD